ncbi:hypothetical protein MTBBW1_1250004 [Desulfamplus magnetovallimortis]|uniref:histidine kinase n=1 Tax=Desulfamplus magnetovallimortis TaxID=1246637 RepID=A0A1W1H6H7_9BACT|nr:response regulator [Desulfamplus magnetovallimortis]SLM28073.1 hypothetical protein MTBBW1_1250004 [Desulfamplus magnetovallimortis]
MKNSEEWKIVVIDDEEDIREVVFIVLQDSGYSVHTAGDGLSGIELCRKVKPQIVLTDIKMPGMGGLEVLETLKSEFESIEVIVITAFGDLDIAIKALQLDASDFITKPLHEDNLQLALSRARERYTSRKKLKEYTLFLEQENISQAKLLHRDKLISLGRLSASVVHEINNPLAGILNYSKLMGKIIRQKSLTPEYIQKFIHYLDLIESESSRVSDIVSSLLTFSRKTSPVISDVSIEQMINKCILLSKHKMELGQISFLCSIAPDIPMIKGDFNQLQQCLINLIFNAIDAMSYIPSNTFSDTPDDSNNTITSYDTKNRNSVGKRGKLEIRAFCESGEKLVSEKKRIAETKGGEFKETKGGEFKETEGGEFKETEGGEFKKSGGRYVVIQVIDNGHGIEKENMKKIFEPFFTTKDEGYGVGLGLSIIFGIMERHGGYVDVSSEPGKGSCFSLKLPI